LDELLSETGLYHASTRNRTLAANALNKKLRRDG
jgi:hypothetical protein